MKSNFSKSVLNASIASACQIFTLLLSFVARSFFIKFLSTEYLGISGLFSNILTILSFTELGIGHVMVYSLYAPLKMGDSRKIRSLLELYKKAYYAIALVILSVGLAITPFIEYLIKETPNVPENIHLLFILYLSNTVASYLCTYKKSLLLADQKTYLSNIVTSTVQLFLVILQIFVLYLTHSFIGYLLCQIFCTLLSNVLLTLIVNYQYRDTLKAKSEILDKEEKRKIFNNIKALAISKVSGIVSSGTDNIIISKMFGLSPVGLVSNYTMIINSVNNVFYNAFTSISAGIGNFNVDSSLEKKRQIFDELFFTVYFVYSFVCVCLLVLIQPFIRVWIGESYILSFSVIINLILGIYVGGMNYPVYSFRTTMGYYKQVQFVYVACAIANIILSIFLGKIIGVTGVFAATWISKFFLTEIADSFFSYKVILKRKQGLYFLKYSLYFAILIVNAMICSFVIRLITVSGWGGLVIKGIVCGVLNIAVNTLLFWRRWEFKSLLRRLGSLWKKKIQKR